MDSQTVNFNMAAQESIQSGKLIPSYDDIMSQRPDIMSFKDIKKEESYAVTSFRYCTLSAVQSQVVVATLWHPTLFPWSKSKTQEVWGVKVLKDFLIGDMKRELPFWIAVPPEKATAQGSYYPLRGLDFTQAQLDHFPWARAAREASSEMGNDRDETMSVCSANSRILPPTFGQTVEWSPGTFKRPRW